MNKVKSPEFGVSGFGSERVLGPLPARQRSVAYKHNTGAFLSCLLVSRWVCLCLCGLQMKNPFLALPPTSTPPDQEIKEWAVGFHAWGWGLQSVCRNQGWDPSNSIARWKGA